MIPTFSINLAGRVPEKGGNTEERRGEKSEGKGKRRRIM